MVTKLFFLLMFICSLLIGIMFGIQYINKNEEYFKQECIRYGFDDVYYPMLSTDIKCLRLEGNTTKESYSLSKIKSNPSWKEVGK